MKTAIPVIIFSVAVLGCVSSPPSISFEEYKNKAEQGDLNAQAEIGYCYQYGDGITKDSEKALKWNLKAATQGSAMAQHNLAVMHDEGVDIPENNSEAIKWYTKASKQGHSWSQLNLGVMYQQGEGVDKDLKHAWDLLNNARFYSNDKNIKWRARAALTEIKKEIGADHVRYYPEWGKLQKSLK